MTRPRPSAVAFRPDGSSYMVDEVGNPVPDDQRIVLTAADLARTVAGYTNAAIAAERQASSASTAELLQATADAAAQATAQAMAQPAFDAGVQYAAQAIAKSTRIRRTVERGPDGLITGIVEVREPIPSTEERAANPIGFRPRMTSHRRTP